MPAEDILRLRRQQYIREYYGQQNPMLQNRINYERRNRQQQQQRKKKRNTELQRSFKKTNAILFTVNKILDGMAVVEKLITANVGLIAAGFLGLIGYINRGDVADFAYGVKEQFGGSEMSAGKTSAQGIKDILQYEGFSSKAYQDQGGIWTIGYGHTGNVKKGDIITKEQALELFKQDLVRFENVVNKSVKVPISQNMFDALVSLAYNIGPNAFANSTLVKKLNQEDYKGAAEEFKKWNKINNKYSQGLTNRREKEAAKFSSDISVNNKLNAKQINVNKTPETVQVGGNVGNISLRSNVKVSNSMKSYLQDIQANGGNFTVTSSMDGKHAGTASNPRSHYSGNKIDIAVRGLSDDQIINSILVPLFKDPRTIEIILEAFPNGSGQRIVDKAKRMFPEVNKKCRLNARYLKAEGSNVNTTGAHIDVLIDPNKGKSKIQEQNKAENKVKITNQQLKERQAKEKEIFKNTTTKKPAPQKTTSTANVTQKSNPQTKLLKVNVGKADPMKARAVRNQSLKTRKFN